MMLMNFEGDPRAPLRPCNAPRAGHGRIRTYNNRFGAKAPAAFSAMFDRVQQKASAGQYRPLVKERQRNIVFWRRYGPGAFLRASLDKRNSPASQPERFIRLRQGLLDDVIKLIHKIRLYVESTGKTHIFFWNRA